MKYNLNETVLCYKVRFVNALLHHLLQLVQQHVHLLKFLLSIHLRLEKTNQTNKEEQKGDKEQIKHLVPELHPFSKNYLVSQIPVDKTSK